MKLIESFVKTNPCYTRGKKMIVRGLMLHSVGCSQPSARKFMPRFDSTEAKVCGRLTLSPAPSLASSAHVKCMPVPYAIQRGSHISTPICVPFPLPPQCHALYSHGSVWYISPVSASIKACTQTFASVLSKRGMNLYRIWDWHAFYMRR